MRTLVLAGALAVRAVSSDSAVRGPIECVILRRATRREHQRRSALRATTITARAGVSTVGQRTPNWVIHLSGHLTSSRLFAAFRRRVMVDIDPGFTQFWHAEGLEGANVAGHDVHFTIGERIGRNDCPIPTAGIDCRRSGSRWCSKTGRWLK
jgi:hypothetical protein